MRDAYLASRLLFVLCTGTGFARAADAPLPLKAGSYVIASYTPCDEAPLAGVTSFDGASFVGPHDADCQTAVLSHRGTRYRVQVTCKAMGDGTPIAPTSYRQDVRIKSQTRFVVTREHREIEYALCPAFH